MIKLWGEVKNWNNDIIRAELRLPLEDETEAILGRMTCEPLAHQIVAINTFVKTLKDNGIWAKTSLLYILLACDQASSLINWIEDDYNLTIVGSPTWLGSAAGWAGNNTHYLDSGVGINAIPLLSQNDSHIWGYGTGVNLSLGYRSPSSPQGHGLTRHQSTIHKFHDFFTTGMGYVYDDLTNFFPFVGASRQNATTMQRYYAGVGTPEFRSDEVSANSIVLPTNNFKVLTCGAGGALQSSGLLACGTGSFLTTTDMFVLYNAFNALREGLL